MKLRLFTGLAAALVLSGCVSYDYVDRGGGYYTGASPQYSGSAYGSYGYGYGYGYGGSYQSYRYRPGWSFGVDFGYPYNYYPYPGGYYGGGYGYYPRPPYYRPYPPRPVHPRPDDHDHRPQPGTRPTVDAGPPPLNRAPWRDIERLRRGEANGEPPPRRPGQNAFVGDAGPQPDAGSFSGGPAPARRPGGLSGDAGVRPPPPVDFGNQAGGRPRFSGEGQGTSARQFQQPSRGAEQRAPRQEPSEPRRPARSETRDTIEP